MSELEPEAAGAALAPQGAAAPAAARGHVSVVYVHGMGSQRRYEETSRLIDRLDEYAGYGEEAGDRRLYGIEVGVEPLRGGKAGDTVSYVRTLSNAGGAAREVRFYEVYWAPVMAENRSIRGVLKWVLLQPWRPWTTAAARWRDRQRLRRSALTTLFEPGRTPPPGTTEADYRRLTQLYDDFEKLDAQRAYPRGGFDDFLAWIDRKAPEHAARLKPLAERWRGQYLREEVGNAFVLTTLLLALALVAGGLVYGVLMLLKELLELTPVAAAAKELKLPMEANLGLAVTVVSAIGAIALGRFVRDYLGDVEAWATYEETNAKHKARNEVLERSMQLLTHVLEDPCERAVLVAHSLGTSVAHDALLALQRRNRAAPPDERAKLDKIHHFVTMASPIDKIEYFFESYASRSHRYKRVVEELRGDIMTAPFCAAGEPAIHWINFWDEADLISGALQSPAGVPTGDPDKDVFRQQIDNVRVSSLGFPGPGASHSGYFQNRKVIGELFDIIYRGARSFRTLTAPPGRTQPDYRSVYLARRQPQDARMIWLAAGATAPWLVLLGLLLWIPTEADTLPRELAEVLWVAAAIIGAALLLGWWFRRRPLHPVTPRRKPAPG